eukprot:732208-Prymnesium_polylepis.1
MPKLTRSAQASGSSAAAARKRRAARMALLLRKVVTFLTSFLASKRLRMRNSTRSLRNARTLARRCRQCAHAVPSRWHV